VSGATEFTGANPEELDALARTFDDCAERLGAAAAGLDRAVAAMKWSGSDSARFRSSWAGHRRRLHRTGDELVDRARFLRAQAEDQRRASASGTATVARGTPGGWALRDAAPASAGESVTVTAMPSGEPSRVSIALGRPVDDAVTPVVSAGLGARIGSEDGVRYQDTTSPTDLLNSLRSGGAAGRLDWLVRR